VNAQITNGGPIILVQAENEYTLCINQTGYYQVNNMTVTEINTACLEKEYMAYVESQFREAGVVVPFIFNDAFPAGNFAPGTRLGAVDIYSFDFYPLGWRTARMLFKCFNLFVVLTDMSWQLPTRLTGWTFSIHSFPITIQLTPK
jgi:hypothetical protein